MENECNVEENESILASKSVSPIDNEFDDGYIITNHLEGI